MQAIRTDLVIPIAEALNEHIVHPIAVGFALPHIRWCGILTFLTTGTAAAVHGPSMAFFVGTVLTTLTGLEKLLERNWLKLVRNTGPCIIGGIWGLVAVEGTQAAARGIFSLACSQFSFLKPVC